jgi:hypothetical protein
MALRSTAAIGRLGIDDGEQLVAPAPASPAREPDGDRRERSDPGASTFQPRRCAGSQPAAQALAERGLDQPTATAPAAASRWSASRGESARKSGGRACASAPGAAGAHGRPAAMLTRRARGARRAGPARRAR